MSFIRPCGSDINSPLYRFILFLVLFEVTRQLVASRCAIAVAKVFAILTETLKVREECHFSSHLLSLTLEFFVQAWRPEMALLPHCPRADPFQAAMAAQHTKKNASALRDSLRSATPAFICVLHPGNPLGSCQVPGLHWPVLMLPSELIVPQPLAWSSPSCKVNSFETLMLLLFFFPSDCCQGHITGYFMDHILNHKMGPLPSLSSYVNLPDSPLPSPLLRNHQALRILNVEKECRWKGQHLLTEAGFRQHLVIYSRGLKKSDKPGFLSYPSVNWRHFIKLWR